MKRKFEVLCTYLFSFVVLLFVFSSCGAILGGTDSYNKKMIDVKVGMTQQEVVAILGDKYINQGVYQSPDGVLNTIYYKVPDSYIYYYLYFLDNHLVEWVRDYDTNSADRDASARANWFREQDRKKELDEMKALKEREVKALEEANKKKKEGAR